MRCVFPDELVRAVNEVGASVLVTADVLLPQAKQAKDQCPSIKVSDWNSSRADYLRTYHIVLRYTLTLSEPS